MFRKDKQKDKQTIKEVKDKKFEIKYNNLTPYGRIGSWLQFIWRF